MQSKPQQELIAVENLQRQGFRTYLPKISQRRQKKGKTIRQIGPMFPRYLFIYLSNQTDDWGPIRSTIGVSSLIRFGLIPAKVPDSLIQNLITRENEEGLQPEIDKELIEGDLVRIAEGPFEGYEAIYNTKLADERVVILLNISEQHARLEISEHAIEKLD